MSARGLLPFVSCSDPQCQPPITLRLPSSCLEVVIVLKKLVPRFFWMETPSGLGKSVHMDSDFPWVTATEYPKHTFNLPGFCGWVNQRHPEDHIPGHHPWNAALEGWALSLAVLLYCLAGGFMCSVYSYMCIWSGWWLRNKRILVEPASKEEDRRIDLIRQP